MSASKKFRRMIPIVEKTSGVILLIAGVLLVSGSFSALSAYFARFTPDFLLEKL
jgi:cytochrome c-type biogenesis protein